MNEPRFDVAAHRHEFEKLRLGAQSEVEDGPVERDLVDAGRGQGDAADGDAHGTGQCQVLRHLVELDLAARFGRVVDAADADRPDGLVLLLVLCDEAAEGLGCADEEFLRVARLERLRLPFAFAERVRGDESVLVGRAGGDPGDVGFDGYGAVAARGRGRARRLASERFDPVFEFAR